MDGLLIFLLIKFRDFGSRLSISILQSNSQPPCRATQAVAMQQQHCCDTINSRGQPQPTAQSQLGTKHERIGELHIIVASFV